MSEPMQVESEGEVMEQITVSEAGIPDFAPIEVAPAPEQAAAFDSNGPRLMITHIVNENFKSYAGVQSLGPFHKSFSSIVGPNGSGKSNVIDSMLFVFGYRASKIRSKKLSVLIHSSDSHKNLNSCNVSVHFQQIIDTGTGDKDFDIVPNSKFVVARTAFKDNSSYYKVNEKKVTYKEVATLLRSSGIDLDHNRFLILQGEVEQIAMMKPKAPTEHEEGMLEFLEDIIGSSRFKTPTDQLSQRLEQLNELRTEKLNRVKAVEKEKDDLETVKDEALQYLTVENEIVKQKSQLFYKYINECQENEQKATQKRDQVKDGFKEQQDQLDTLTESKKAKTKEHKKIVKHHEEMVVQCEEKKGQFSAFEQQDVRCREDLKHAKAKAKKLDKTLDSEQKKLEELKQIPEKTSRDVEDLQRKLDKLEKEKAKEEEKLAEVMESLKTETQGLQGEKDGKEIELMELQKAVNNTKSKYNVSQSELDLYFSNLNREKSKLQETKNNLEKASTTLKDRKSAVKELEKKAPECEKSLSQAKHDLEAAVQAEQDAAQQVKNIRVKVEDARSSLQSASSRGNVLEALMQIKASGRLPGILGRLGDLGAIDEKYDVAISTACGALDNIVVDSLNTGQQCVEFLKKNNIGSATFIGLDKMAKWQGHCSRAINTPESVPRLFDLIKTADESVKPAFYFALRDTLVAKDLDQATRIAYGKTRYRVVTLSGQLIDQSGTMSGGGGRVSKGRMGSHLVEQVDPKHLQQLEKDLSKLSLEAQQSRDTKLKLEDGVEKLQRSLRDIKHALDKFSMEIQSLTEQEGNLKVQLKEQEGRVKEAAPDQKHLKQLENTVAEHKQAYEKDSEAASKKEEEVHRLHRQIMDIGGSKLKAAESRVNLVQTQIDQATGHVTKANVAVKTSERNARKTETKVESLKEEQQENAAQIDKLEGEFKQLEEDATKVLEAYQKVQEEMNEAESALAEVKAAVEGLDKEEQQIQKDLIEVKHELEKYETIVKENQHKIKHWKKELGRLSLHTIEGQDEDHIEEKTAEELMEMDKEEMQYQITVLEQQLAQMKPNMAAIAEYRKKEEMYLKRVGELDQITDLRDAQRKQHEDLRKQRLDEFMAGFTVITNKLKEMYQMITLGGDAELELVDSLDPFSEGIVFSVRPPKKSWKNISNLSGGEKTLSSLALVFALHHYKPTPLYVMDEIDAALDFKNVSIVANYIKERTKNAQFIIISLRNNMFELADRLIGIYKTYNCTKSVTINPTKISLPLQELNPNVTVLKS